MVCTAPKVTPTFSSENGLHMASTQLGCTTQSASVKRSRSPEAASIPFRRAYCLGFPVWGFSVRPTTVTGNSLCSLKRSIKGLVVSMDRSSTRIISIFLLFSEERDVNRAGRLFSSFLAGIIMETSLNGTPPEAFHCSSLFLQRIMPTKGIYNLQFQNLQF